MNNASLAPDVVRLVIAARVVAFEDKGEEAIKELDEASEAFADRVPWDDEPFEDAALSTPNAPVEKEAIALDDAAKKLAAWLGYSWDGIRDDRIADKGFKPWCFDGLGHKRFQGGKEDLRDIVREILAVR